MRNRHTAPTEAYPDAHRTTPEDSAHTPEWLVRLITALILFVLEHVPGGRLNRAFPRHSWYQDRPDLPAGSTQAEAASIRGQFGTAIAWMCRRHGIGPGHPEWPELSRAIVAFGGSVARFRAGLPPCGLQWWDNPNVIPGMGAGFGAPAAPTAAQLQAAANAAPPPPHATPAKAAHATLPASWLPASVRQVFARAGPGLSTGPPKLPGTATSSMSDARGRQRLAPAARFVPTEDLVPGTPHACNAFDPLAFLPAL